MSERDVKPVLVVVGRANRGKSTLVATLSEAADVRISATPGETRLVESYPVMVEGEELLTLVDTPGFEDAVGALRMLQQLAEPNVPDRKTIVSFLDAFRRASEFQQECRLLKPILDGGAILYMVDAAFPFRSHYEAEMEILRISGAPRMALINRTAESDFSESWADALGRHFGIVRRFDARDASFADRLELLRGLRVLRDEWREPMERAVAALERQRHRRLTEASEEIALMLESMLTHTDREPVRDRDDEERLRDVLELRFHEDLKRKEAKARRRVEELYGHRSLEREESELDAVIDDDLFSNATWRLLGLSSRQLMTVGIVGGAATGSLLDVATGGATLGTGTILGGMGGAATALYLGRDQFARAALEGSGMRVPDVIRRRSSSSRAMVIGPHRHPNFPWVLIDRAILHLGAVRARSHARRDPMSVSASDEKAGPTAAWNPDVRRDVAALIHRMTRSTGEKRRAARSELALLLKAQLRE